MSYDLQINLEMIKILCLNTINHGFRFLPACQAWFVSCHTNCVLWSAERERQRPYHVTNCRSPDHNAHVGINQFVT